LLADDGHHFVQFLSPTMTTPSTVPESIELSGASVSSALTCEGGYHANRQALPANKDKRKRLYKWRPAHELQYCVQVAERDAHTFVPLSIMCKLCEYFGREAKAATIVEDVEGNGAKKRKKPTPPLKTVKCFKPPFRTDKYVQHLKIEHKLRWEEYKTLNDLAKRQYFDSVTQHRCNSIGVVTATTRQDSSARLSMPESISSALTPQYAKDDWETPFRRWLNDHRLPDSVGGVLIRLGAHDISDVAMLLQDCEEELEKDLKLLDLAKLKKAVQEGKKEERLTLTL
jgi:hypothetical protein